MSQEGITKAAEYVFSHVLYQNQPQDIDAILLNHDMDISVAMSDEKLALNSKSLAQTTTLETTCTPVHIDRLSQNDNESVVHGDIDQLIDSTTPAYKKSDEILTSTPIYQYSDISGMMDYSKDKSEPSHVANSKITTRYKRQSLSPQTTNHNFNDFTGVRTDKEYDYTPRIPPYVSNVGDIDDYILKSKENLDLSNQIITTPTFSADSMDIDDLIHKSSEKVTNAQPEIIISSSKSNSLGRRGHVKKSASVGHGFTTTSQDSTTGLSKSIPHLQQTEPSQRASFVSNSMGLITHQPGSLRSIPATVVTEKTNDIDDMLVHGKENTNIVSIQHDDGNFYFSF